MQCILKEAALIAFHVIANYRKVFKIVLSKAFTKDVCSNFIAKINRTYFMYFIDILLRIYAETMNIGQFEIRKHKITIVFNYYIDGTISIYLY